MCFSDKLKRVALRVFFYNVTQKYIVKKHFNLYFLISMNEQNHQLYFLNNGGEMGQLTRDKNWEATSLGTPETWPQSLRTMVSAMLENPFGMYIAWGEDHVQLYNDAYRVILGSTKHPHALGNTAKETFAEKWHTIEPTYKSVLLGKSVIIPNYELALNQNGFDEECHYDFSYSPIRQENGKVGGILVTVVEITNRKKAEQAVVESEIKFETLADNIPNLVWMANAHGWIYWFNKRWYEYTGTTAKDMEGWGWQSVHDPHQLDNVLIEWKNSLALGKPFEMVFPLKGTDGNFRPFLTRVLPMRNQAGEIYQWFGTNTDISEQLRAEEALKESEERFRNMAEDSDIYINVADETGNATYFNRAWIKFTGRPMKDLIQFGWADLIHEEDRQNFVDIYLDAFLRQEPWVGEFKMLTANNEYRWLLAKGTPKTNADGTFAGYVSSCTDISNLKNAQHALKSSEQRFKNLVKQSPVAMVILRGPEHKIEIANAVVEKRWGYGTVDFSNKTIGDLFPVLRQQQHKVLLDEVYKTGKSFREYESEVYFKQPEGFKTCYFDFEYAPLLEEDGSVSRIITTIIDVTEHVEARQAIEKSEKKFRLLADSMPQHIWTSDIYGNLNYFNKSVYDYSGLSSERVWTDGWIQIIHPDDRDENIRVWRESISTGKNFLFEHRFCRHDGEYRWQLSRAIPQLDEHGKIQMWVGTSTDIQDQKNFTQELESQVNERTKQIAKNNIELEKMNKELQSFAYISSHDLQEPLRKIQIFSSQILESESENLSDTGKDKFMRMQNSANRMQTLIEDLLTYSRTGTAEKSFEQCDLTNIVDDVKEEMQEELFQKKAVIEVNGECNFSVITFQFRQLLYNLISNSLKFTLPDHHPHIVINCKKVKGVNCNNEKLVANVYYWHISFTDNGIGFENQYSQRIFEVFQRLHGKKEYQGTGIGLAIVKKIVENHGGIITARGKVDNGATFDIYIPEQIK